MHGLRHGTPCDLPNNGPHHEGDADDTTGVGSALAPTTSAVQRRSRNGNAVHQARYRTARSARSQC
jgi:hypothetical protein